MVSGDQSLAGILRVVTAAELFLHAAQYKDHPKFKAATEDTSSTYDSISTYYSMALSQEASANFDQFNDMAQAVRKEAFCTCIDRQWGAVIHVMALASVLAVNIWLAYPQANSAVRPLCNGTITPVSRAQPNLESAYIQPCS
jgi:hypothetical protein